MALLDKGRSFQLAPLSRFGAIEQQAVALCSVDCIQVLKVPGFEMIFRKEYSSNRVLDVVLKDGSVWVLLATSEGVAIETFRDFESYDSATRQLNVPLRDQLDRLYRIGDSVFVTGANARRSLLVSETASQVVPASQVHSVQAISGTQFSVVTDVYGTGAVLKIFESKEGSERVREVAEVSLRDILFAKQLGAQLQIISTDDEQLFCGKLDVSSRRLVEDMPIEGLSCLFLQRRFKLLGDGWPVYGYPVHGFSGMVGVDTEALAIRFCIDFGCRAYDAACCTIGEDTYACYIDEHGVGASWSGSSALHRNAKDMLALSCSSLGDLNLNNQIFDKTVDDEDRVLRLRQLGL